MTRVTDSLGYEVLQRFKGKESCWTESHNPLCSLVFWVFLCLALAHVAVRLDLHMCIDLQCHVVVFSEGAELKLHVRSVQYYGQF